MSKPPTLQVHNGIAVWSGGSSLSDTDIWFLHGFGESHLFFRDAFAHPISDRARIFLFDFPGCGASPPRPTGLSIEEAAQVCRDLIANFSVGRRIVLVAHSVAGIIATATALTLGDSLRLIISIEGNLTLADAYFSGQAAKFDDPEAFYTSFVAKVLKTAKYDEMFRLYSCSLQFADPRTLWTLGRSALCYAFPGLDYMRLRCSTIYYWDPASTSDDTMVFLAQHDPPQRELEGLGHWPMIKSPSQFYAAVEQDIFADGTG